MSDERRLAELGKLAREERMLEQRPAAADVARPLSSGELDAIAGRAADLIAKQRGAGVVPLRGRDLRRWRIGGAIAAPLAIAAAIALVLARHPRDDRAPLASYELVVEGGERTVRGSASAPAQGPVRLSREGRVALILRPRIPASERVSARAMIGDGDAMHPWRVSIEASPEGALRIDAGPEALAQLPSGPSRVVLFVGDEARLPADGASARRAVEHKEARVQVLTLDVVIE